MYVCDSSHYWHPRNHFKETRFIQKNTCNVATFALIISQNKKNILQSTITNSIRNKCTLRITREYIYSQIKISAKYLLLCL